MRAWMSTLGRSVNIVAPSLAASTRFTLRGSSERPLHEKVRQATTGVSFRILYIGHFSTSYSLTSLLPSSSISSHSSGTLRNALRMSNATAASSALRRRPQWSGRMKTSTSTSPGSTAFGTTSSISTTSRSSSPIPSIPALSIGS